MFCNKSIIIIYIFFYLLSRRYTSDKQLFTQLIEATKLKQYQDETRWDLGGNAPVMGTRFFKEGADVLLAATMSKQ